MLPAKTAVSIIILKKKKNQSSLLSLNVEKKTWAKFNFFALVATIRGTFSLLLEIKLIRIEGRLI